MLQEKQRAQRGNGSLTEWRSPAEGFLERHDTYSIQEYATSEASNFSATLHSACAHKHKKKRGSILRSSANGRGITWNPSGARMSRS